MSPVPSVQVNYNETTFKFMNSAADKLVVSAHQVEFGHPDTIPSNTTTLTKTGILSYQDTFDMSFNELTFGGVAGTDGQVLTTNSSGVAHWDNLPVPSLSDVLNVSGVANVGQTISNLASIGLQADNVAPIVISQSALTGSLNVTSANTSLVLDDSKETMTFTGNYLIVSINDVQYRLQLFTV